MRFVLIGIFTATLLSACNTALPKSEIAKIELLQMQIDSSLKNYAEIDTVLIQDISKKYFDDIDYFKTNYKDTVDKELAIFIDRYYGLHKPILFLQNEYALINSELTTTQQQLVDLKRDAEEGLVELKHFEQYLELEKENSELIIQNVNKMIRTFHKTTTAYNNMSPTIDSIIQANKKKKEPV